jgi:hypothetical protein
MTAGLKPSSRSQGHGQALAQDDPLGKELAWPLADTAVTSRAPSGGPGRVSDANVSALMALVCLALPVSTLASIMGLEMDGVSLALSADGCWVALALAALLCSPQVRRRSKASSGIAATSVPPQGDA